MQQNDPVEQSSPATKKTIQDRGPNFRAGGTRLYLVRCYACDPEHGRENWAPAVASGTCAHCGWNEKDQ